MKTRHAVEMVMRGVDLFRDPKIGFDEAVQKLAVEFQCPRVMAERCMGAVVEAAVAASRCMGAVA